MEYRVSAIKKNILSRNSIIVNLVINNKTRKRQLCAIFPPVVCC